MPLAAFADLPDEQLVRLYQTERKDEIFEVLYRRYERQVWLYCYKIIGDKEEARDMTSEVFLKVFEKLSLLRDARTFPAWLFRIARNRSINHGIKKSRRPHLPISEGFCPGVHNCDIQEFEETEANVAKMYRAFLALPETTQMLLRSKYFDGDSIERLMDRYQLSESAVKMRLARARSKANKLLTRA